MKKQSETRAQPRSSKWHAIHVGKMLADETPPLANRGMKTVGKRIKLA
jgi:hypothetical protein